MKPETQNKFAEILAAAQKKAAEQNKPIEQPVKPETKQPEAIEHPQQELSTMTIEDLLNDDKPVYCTPCAVVMPFKT